MVLLYVSGLEPKICSFFSLGSYSRDELVSLTQLLGCKPGHRSSGHPEFHDTEAAPNTVNLLTGGRWSTVVKTADYGATLRGPKSRLIHLELWDLGKLLLCASVVCTLR